MSILKYCELLGDSVILQNLSLRYFPISIPVLTACLKLSSIPHWSSCTHCTSALPRTDISFPPDHRYAEAVLKSSSV